MLRLLKPPSAFFQFPEIRKKTILVFAKPPETGCREYSCYILFLLFFLRF